MSNRARRALRVDDREFAESLRLLVEREQYSAKDIGMMFGVSRQRVAQWLVQAGIELPDEGNVRGMFAFRAWDDSRHRFVPVPRMPFRRGEAMRRTEMATVERTRLREERREQVVAAVAELKARHSRDPFWPEIFAALGLTAKHNCHCMAVVAYWGRGRAESTASVVAEIRSRTGLGYLPRGTHSHRALAHRGPATVPVRPERMNLWRPSESA